MKPQIALSVAGLVMLFTPGCCVFEHVFGCGGHYYHGAGSCGDDHCDGGKISKKCAKKCRKCRECLEEEGEHHHAGIGHDHGGLVMADGSFGGAIGGDFGCGCGGGIGHDPFSGGMSGGCASCGTGGPGPFQGAMPGMMPGMMPSPTPVGPGASSASEAFPTPASGVNLSHPQSIPAIPAMDSSSTMTVPPGVQQVSVEEFQRLPGVVVSGPNAGAAASSPPAMASSVPGTISVTGPVQPAQPAATKSFSPASARQVQQAGWAPVRK